MFVPEYGFLVELNSALYQEMVTSYFSDIQIPDIVPDKMLEPDSRLVKPEGIIDHFLTKLVKTHYDQINVISDSLAIVTPRSTESSEQIKQILNESPYFNVLSKLVDPE